MGKRFHWLRLHTEIVDDVKMAELSGEEFRLWIFLICVAGENEIERGAITGGAKTIAWRTRNNDEFVASSLKKFEGLGLVRITKERVVIVNFDKRQYDNPSDAPEATRDRKRRSREESESVTTESRPRHDTEERREEKKREEKTDKPADAGPSAQEVANAWNATTTPPIPKVSRLTDGRRKKVQARSQPDRGLPWWFDYFSRINRSSFCRGAKGWKADFDWAVSSEEVVAKVFEGRYDGTAGPPPTPEQARLALDPKRPYTP